MKKEIKKFKKFQNRSNRRAPATIITVLISIALSFMIFIFVRDWEEERWQSSFERVARDKDFAIKMSLKQQIELIQAAGAVIDSTKEFNPNNLRRYSKSVMLKHPEIKYIGWMDHVLKSEIEEYTNNNPSLKIVEKNQSKIFISANKRDNYFPISFIEPEIQYGKMIGYSPTAEEDELKDTIQESLKWGNATASAPSIRSQGQTEITLYKPIYEKSSSMERLRGLVFFQISISSLINGSSIDKENHLDMSIFTNIYDTTDNSNIKIFSSSLTSKAGSVEINTESRYKKNISFGNRKWTIAITPSQGFMSNQIRWVSGLSLTVGLFLSGLLLAFLGSMNRHTKEVEEIISDRTKQLSKANAVLAKSISDKEMANQALKKSESRYRLLTESSTDIIARHNLEGVCLYASSASTSLIGYAPEEVIGHSIYPLLHKDDIELMRQTHSELIRKPQILTVTYRAKHRDGHYIWFEAICQTILDPEEELPIEIQSVSRDITNRKIIEESLKENEERFRSAFDDASIGMAIISTEGVIQRANNSMCSSSGYLKEELNSVDIHKIIHPADIEKTLNKMETVLNGDSKTFQIETRVLHKSGSILWILANGSLVYKENEPLYFVVQLQDITQRKEAEKSLTILNRTHELILNATSEGIFGLDNKGNITFINSSASKMLGYSLEESLGKNMTKLIQHTKIDNSPYDTKDSAIIQALVSGETCSITNDIFWKKDGTSFPTSYVCTPIKEENNIDGAVVVFSNKTDGLIGALAKKMMLGDMGEENNRFL